MILRSRLLAGDERLEAAAVLDAAHIVPGERGDHVTKIQNALIRLDSAPITADGAYGPMTAAAVLTYKLQRGIINRAYQTTPDDIVGKMTIAALDRELLGHEPPPGDTVCVLDCACPVETPRFRLAFAITGGAAAAAGDDADQRMQLALSDSRRTLREAIVKLQLLQQGFTRAHLPFGAPLSADEQKILNSAVKWLNLDPSQAFMTLVHLADTVGLMRRNLTVRNSKRAMPEMKRVPETFHGRVDGNPDNGIELGDSFFNQDGPNCRRDVITHEFFHFLGVKHGGGALMGPTIRSAITTPAQALNSADNLAQLVAELTTPTGNTDACARAGE